MSEKAQELKTALIRNTIKETVRARGLRPHTLLTTVTIQISPSVDADVWLQFASMLDRGEIIFDDDLKVVLPEELEDA